MGNCLRKPMREGEDGALITGTVKPTVEPSFANDEARDAVDLTGPAPVSGIHENPLASLATKGTTKGRGSDTDDEGDSRSRYNGRKNRTSDDEDGDRRRRRGRRYDDESDEDDGRSRRRGKGRGGRYNDDDDDDDDDRERRSTARSRRGRGRDYDDEDDDDARLEDRRRSRAKPVSKGTNPFGDDDDDEPAPSVRSGKTGPAATTAPSIDTSKKSTNPFGDDDDDNMDARSVRSTTTQRTTVTNKTTAMTNNDDFASIKSKGQTQVNNKRPPFEDVVSTSSASFAADARALRNSQLKSASYISSEDDDADANGTSNGSGRRGDMPAKPRMTAFGQMKKKICSVKLDVRYVTSRQVLIVHVHDVEGLSERKFGIPNLYVKLYISPDPKRRTKRKSMVIEKNSLPNFDERFEFKIPPNDIDKRSLRLALWEQGTMSNSVLGELSIGFASYASKGDFAFNEYFAISRKTRNPQDPNALNPTASISGPEDNDSDDAKSVRSVRSTMSTESGRNPFGESDDEDGDARSIMTSASVTSVTPKLTDKGSKRKKLCNIKLAVGFNSVAGVLRVHVQELGELPWTEETKPDLYVKMFIAPDPNKETKRKTRVINNNLAPKFDELFEWRVSATEVRGKSLIVSLCEEGTLSNDILGEFAIGFHNFEGDFEWDDWFAINKKKAMGSRMSLTRRVIPKNDVHQYAPDDGNDARSTHSSEGDVIKPQLTEQASKKNALAHVKLDISYEAARGTFQLHIHKIKGLDNFAIMDIFLILWLHPDKDKTLRQTKTQRTLKMVDFDEKYEFKYAVGEVQRRSLVLQLWQDNSMGKDDKSRNKMLAQVSIGFKSTEGSNFAWADWYTLFDKRK